MTKGTCHLIAIGNLHRIDFLSLSLSLLCVCLDVIFSRISVGLDWTREKMHISSWLSMVYIKQTIQIMAMLLWIQDWRSGVRFSCQFSRHFYLCFSDCLPLRYGWSEIWRQLRSRWFRCLDWSVKCTTVRCIPFLICMLGFPFLLWEFSPGNNQCKQPFTMKS